MSGLKAIILYNSFLKGLKTRLPCDGHTNLGGDNGVGKTSALKLIPIFYGQEPNRVVERSASKASFIDYYLPNYQSMVIFEYERLNGDTCCAAFYRPRSGEGQTHAHRFVMGKADDTIFHPSLNGAYGRKEDAATILGHHLKDLDVLVSQQHLRTSHYRDVINNTAHLTRRRQKGSSKTASLREDARSFSLGGLDDKLQHMHELTSVTLDSNRLISRLKKMLIDTQVRHNVHVQDSRPNANNASTWRDIASLQSFERARPELMRGVDTYSQIIEARHEVASYLQAMQHHLDKVRDAISQKNDLLIANKREKEEAEERADTEQRQANSALSILKGERDALEHEIDALYDERDRWEEKGIDAIAIRYNNLPALRQQLTSLQHTLDALRKEGEEAEANYDKERSAAFERFQRRLEPLQRNKEQMVQALHDLKQRHEEALQALTRRWEQEAQAAIETIDEEITRLQSQQSELMMRLESASQPTEEERAEREASNDAIAHAEESCEKATQAFQACQLAIQAASDDLRSEESRLTQAEASLSRVEEARDALLRNRHAEEGTLLAYLRQQYPGWGDTVGKVISVDLLQRKDLSPEVVSEDTTLFGLSLTLDHLGKPDEALEEEQLDRLLADAGQDVRRAKEAVTTCEEGVKRARKHHTEQTQQQVVLGNRQTSEKERLKGLKASDKALADRHREAAKQRQQGVRQQIEGIASKIKDATSQKSRVRQETERQAQEERLELKGEQADALSLHTHAIEEQEGLIATTKTQHDEHLKALKSALDNALSEKGVDIKARDKAKQAVDDAAAEIDELEGHKDEIAKYQHWRQYQFPEAERKATQLRGVERQVSDQEKVLRQLKEQAEATLSALKEARRILKKDLEKLNREDQDWTSLVNRGATTISTIPTNAEPSSLTDPSHLGDGAQVAEQLDQRTRQIGKQIEGLRQISEKCRGIINDHPNTQVHQAWNNSYQRLVDDEGFENHTVELAIASMRALSDLMHDRLPEIERALTQEVRGMANHMVKYHGSLKNLNSEINRVSRDLKTKLNTEHSFPAISDIQVRLLSLISGDEQWKPLTAFSEQWGKWLATQPKGLPDDTLLGELRQLDEAYRNSRGGSSDVDDLVDIEIQLTENGRTVPIRNDKDFSDASSAGLSMMAVLIIFSGLTRYLCPNEAISVTWPVDELGKIDSHNVQRLFAMMQRRNIHIFCAQPSATPEMLRRFEHRIVLDKGKGALIVKDDEAKKTLNPRFEEANKALEAQA